MHRQSLEGLSTAMPTMRITSRGPPHKVHVEHYLSRGSSQRGSSGSSYSETPASMGVPLEERREGRTNRTPEFMDALESADTYREAWGHPSSEGGVWGGGTLFTNDR